MTMKTIINQVAIEMETVLSNVSDSQAKALSQELQTAKRIFITGEGRSGLMGKAIAMRLMHSGYTVFAVGETITPSVEEGDLLVAISGSGTTGAIKQFVTKAKEAGARTALVTTNDQSPIAAISDLVLVIPAATKFRREDEPETIQPLGNQFDQAVHLVLDAIIIGTVKGEGYEEMTRRHANME
ncbi:6-phospho-3-hexuloisomerase [Alteribacter lacisalsi]|nr:6-phospho-3-hexuloisomerase [Alteribacter lacisalsi]